MWSAMDGMGFPTHMTELLGSLYASQSSTARTGYGDSDRFPIGHGVRQGCIGSPYLYNNYAERIMRTSFDGFHDGVTTGGQRINNLRYADNKILVASWKAEMQDLVERVRRASEDGDLFLNVKKTKLMQINDDDPNTTVTVDAEVSDIVESFNLLGSHVTNKCGSIKEINIRLAITRKACINMAKLGSRMTRRLQHKFDLCAAFPLLTKSIYISMLTIYTVFFLKTGISVLAPFLVQLFNWCSYSTDHIFRLI